MAEEDAPSSEKDASAIKVAAEGGARLPALRVAPGRAPGPRRRGALLWGWATAFALIAALALGLGPKPWAARITTVAVEIAQPAPATRVLAVNGRIAARHSVDVRSLVEGSLADLPVDEGEQVTPGAILARIDSATQEAILQQAEAGLDAAQVTLEQAQAALERAEALGPNIARTLRDDAESAAQAAAQDVLRARALVDQARAQLERYTIRAPMAGTVLVVNVDPGQIVSPSTVILTVADLSQLLVETDVDESHATQIRTGMPAVLQLAGETALRGGRVSFVSQQVDPATGGLVVKLAFDDPVSAPVGLTVTANIVVERREAALTVPRSAIVTQDGVTSVFVVLGGTALRREVCVIDWPAGRLIVTEGLNPGEAVIADAAGIRGGARVREARP